MPLARGVWRKPLDRREVEIIQRMERALNYPVTQIAIAVDRNKSTVYRALSIDLRQQIYRASRAGGPPGWQRKRDGLAGGGPGGQRTAPGGPGGRPGRWRTGPGGPTQVARQAARQAGRQPGRQAWNGGGGGGGQAAGGVAGRP